MGLKAARDLISKLDAESPPAAAGSVPVVFSPDAARQLVSIFAKAVAGNAVVRGMTFLGDKKDQKVFPADISIVDDPTLPRGFGSLPIDGDGIVPQKIVLVENGVLKNFLLGLKSARQIEAESGVKTASNGHANGATNLILKSSSAVSPDQLIAGIADGFYVTEIQVATTPTSRPDSSARPRAAGGSKTASSPSRLRTRPSPASWPICSPR